MRKRNTTPDADRDADADATSEDMVVVPESATTADEALVDAVVEKIQGILAKTVAKGMDEVGHLLLRDFFDDNPDLYTSASHTKHASLQLLLDRCETMDLPVRRTFLANSLQMAVFTRRLPKGSQFLLLPSSHRVELLRLGSPERAETVAAAAVEKRMTVRKVRAVVRKEREKNKSPRGRKPTPPILRAIGFCVRTLRDQTTGKLAFKRDDIGQLNEDQRAGAKELAETLSKRIDELIKLLG